MSLQQRIARAFPVLEPPQLPTLALDDCSFCVAIHRALSGRAWDAVPLDVLEDQANSLVQLTPEAFAYYLPAFISAALERPEKPGVGSSDVLDFTVQTLCDPDLPDDVYWSERVSLLSMNQRAAVAAFLEWVVRLLATEDDEERLRDQARAGLEKYWAHQVAK